MFGRPVLLCRFGIFDCAIHIFGSRSHKMFNIEQYYISYLCAVLISNHEIIFKKLEVNISTNVIVCGASSLLMITVMLLQNTQKT